jgi:hypothetical protein
MIRKLMLLTVGVLSFGCSLFAPSHVRAQSPGGRYEASSSEPSFGQGAEASRIQTDGEALVREKESIAKFRTRINGQFSSLNQREAELAQAITQWRCPHGQTLRTCSCGASDRARPRFQSESRSINVERQRLKSLNDSLNSRIALFNQRLNRYNADRQSYASRYEGDNKRQRGSDGSLFFDESAPKPR